jgi:hypothetical protein
MTLCIAGMPRSGTSLVTQLLHRCGLDLGPAEHLMPASDNNPEGFWENLQFVRVNERLLSASGGTWFAPPAGLRPTKRIEAQARAIATQFEGRTAWGWKDPRSAVTAGFWKTVFPSMKVLVCVRHPGETASSLLASTLIPHSARFYWSVTRPGSRIRLRRQPPGLLERMVGAAATTLSRRNRQDLILEVGLDLWRVYNESVLDATDRSERLVTHYDALLENPSAALERILAFAELPVLPAVVEEALRVVKPRRRSPPVSAPLRPETGQLYERLCREAEWDSSRVE